MKINQIMLWAGGPAYTHVLSFSIKILMKLNQILLWAGGLPHTHNPFHFQLKLNETQSDSAVGWWTHNPVQFQLEFK